MIATRKNAIVFLGAWFDACALWRLYIPHLSMPGSGFYIFAGRQGPNFNLIGGYDICVVQRCCTEPQFNFIHMVRSLGIKLVYDIDDDVFDLPEYNPAHKALMAQRDGFLACMRSVDVISVSTKTLAKVVRKNVRAPFNVHTGKEIPILVAENRIDTRMFVSPIPRTGSGPVLIGWAGSSSHIGDLALVQGALLDAATIPEVKIQFRGCELAKDDPLAVLPNYEFKYWTPVAQYGGRMPLWDWDIALAPVTDHPFNASKSCLKMVEAGYCGIPCLASYVRPYEEFCQYDNALQWLLCASPSSWQRKLRELVHDSARRLDLGIRMRKVVEEHYSLDKPHEGWEAVFQAARNI